MGNLPHHLPLSHLPFLPSRVIRKLQFFGTIQQGFPSMSLPYPDHAFSQPESFTGYTNTVSEASSFYQTSAITYLFD